MDIVNTLDPILIQLYRATGNALADYLAGTFLLAFMSAFIGKCTGSLILRFNRRHITKMANELEEKHRLSMVALHQNDESAYRAINNQASEAYGRYYFNMAAHSFVSLWPVPFALEWMQSRFSAVELPFFQPLSSFLPPLGYFAVFLLCYVLSRIVLKNMRIPGNSASRTPRGTVPLNPLKAPGQ